MDKVYNVYVFLCWDIVYLQQCHADMMWAVFSLQNSGATVVFVKDPSKHDTWIDHEVALHGNVLFKSSCFVLSEISFKKTIKKHCKNVFKYLRV